MEKKIYHIVSQDIETIPEAYLLKNIISLAKEAGYTHIHDHWGHKAWDEYTIDEAIDRFVIKLDAEAPTNEELPF